MFTNKEILVKNYLERRFIPYIDDLFKRSNPTMYAAFNGNFCRQAAIFGVILLEELLPEYIWYAWEGEFDDIFENRKVNYEHAWIFGQNKQDKSKLLIDLSRNYRERLFIKVGENKYPKEHPEYKNMKEKNRKQISIEESMKEYEFYTSLSTEKVLKKIKKATNFVEVKNKLESIVYHEQL